MTSSARGNGHGHGGHGHGKFVKRVRKERLPLVERLAEHIGQGRHQAVLHEAEELGKKATGPERDEVHNTLEIKLVSLLQLDKPYEVLHLLEEHAQREEFVFERSYCFYRLKQYDRALEILRTGKKTERDKRMRHLEAQIQYRRGDYTTVVDLYNGMLNELDFDDEERTYVEANISAAEARLEALRADKEKAAALMSTEGTSMASSSALRLFDELESTVPKQVLHTRRRNESSRVKSTRQRRNGRGKARSKRPRALQDDPSKKMLAKPPPELVFPERWIPRTQRASYRARLEQREKERQKRQKGRTGGGGGAGGGEVTGFGSQGAKVTSTAGTSDKTAGLGGTGSIGLARSKLAPRSEEKASASAVPPPVIEGRGTTAPKALLDSSKTTAGAAKKKKKKK